MYYTRHSNRPEPAHIASDFYAPPPPLASTFISTFLSHPMTSSHFPLSPGPELATLPIPFSPSRSILWHQSQGLDQPQSSDYRWTTWLDPSRECSICLLCDSWRGCWVWGLVCSQICTYLSSALNGRGILTCEKERWTVDTKRRTPTPAKKSTSSF